MRDRKEVEEGRESRQSTWRCHDRVANNCHPFLSWTRKTAHISTRRSGVRVYASVARERRRFGVLRGRQHRKRTGERSKGEEKERGKRKEKPLIHVLTTREFGLAASFRLFCLCVAFSFYSALRLSILFVGSFLFLCPFYFSQQECAHRKRRVGERKRKKRQGRLVCLSLLKPSSSLRLSRLVLQITISQRHQGKE